VRKIVFLLIIGLLSFGNAMDKKFTDKKAMYNGREIGEVQYKNQTIMRLMEKGEYLTPHARAQIVSYRLNEHIKTINDVKNIIYKYPNDIYTAYLNNRKLFSIYASEVTYNGSTPEGLMGSWINNLKRVMIVDGIPESKKIQINNEEIVPGKELNKKQKKKKESLEKNDAKSVVKESTSTGVDIVELNELKDKIKKLEKQVKKPEKGSNSIVVLVIIALNIVISLVLVILYLKVRKRLGIYSQLEKTENLEELENTVSVLIKELQGTSETVTEKAQNAIKELDAKIASAPQVGISSNSPLAEGLEDLMSTDPVQEAIPAPEAPIAPAAAVPEVSEPEVAVAEPTIKEPRVDANLEEVLSADLEKEVADIKEVVEKVHASADNSEASPAPVSASADIETGLPEQVPEEKPIAEKLAEEIDKQKEEGAIEELATVAATGAESEDDEFEAELRKEMDGILVNEALTQNEKVVQLASMNVMQEDIAKELSMGVGEVELILQLNK